MLKQKDSDFHKAERSTCDTQIPCTEAGKTPEFTPRADDIATDSQKTISQEEVEAPEHKHVLSAITPSKCSKRLEEKRGTTISAGSSCGLNYETQDTSC